MSAGQHALIARVLSDVAECIAEPGPSYLEGLSCGVEDRGITDRYEAAAYGWQQAFEYVQSAMPSAEALSALASASGTGTRVDGLEEAARWHDGRAKSQRALVALSRADRDFQTAALDENSEIVHRNSAAAIRALASREPATGEQP